ncbi:MAG: methionine adenosyltransferase, partial [Nitrospirae bacterium]|nr:methionine adenosyltransferase [Nitrospirota bacterium]
MERDILVERLRGTPVAGRQVEIVERKGVGHPDSICDAVAEEISRALNREYLERFGAVLHHNMDKGLLVAGRVAHRFGGGEVLSPMRMVLGDRAVSRLGEEEIPVREIAVETARRWFKENFRFIEPERHLTFQVEIQEGSAELTDLFHRGGEFLGSNDTSAAVGYAPLTETERLVLETEGFLNSREFKASYPETGEDVKIMGVRRDRELSLTVAVPFLDRYIGDAGEYFEKKERVRRAVGAFIHSKKIDLSPVVVYHNTLDSPDRGMGGMYLSVLGTSAEDGDSGQVGRGNRANGVIALNRPAAAEAAPGKNAVSHVGKIYSILTHVMAHRIYDTVPGIQEVYVWLFNQIGVPIDRPR